MLIKQAVSIVAIVVAILALSSALPMHAQTAQPATTTNFEIGPILPATSTYLHSFPTSTRRSNGTPVTLTGTLNTAFESPGCFPKCGLPSIAFSYLTTANGENYRLLGSDPNYQDGTQVIVTGWLYTPSGWSGSMFQPTLTFAGDIAVTSIQAQS